MRGKPSQASTNGKSREAIELAFEAGQGLARERDRARRPRRRHLTAVRAGRAITSDAVAAAVRSVPARAVLACSRLVRFACCAHAVRRPRAAPPLVAQLGHQLLQRMQLLAPNVEPQTRDLQLTALRQERIEAPARHAHALPRRLGRVRAAHLHRPLAAVGLGRH